MAEIWRGKRLPLVALRCQQLAETEGLLLAAARCQKLAKKGVGWAAVSCRELRENDRIEERGEAAVSCHEVPEN